MRDGHSSPRPGRHPGGMPPRATRVPAVDLGAALAYLSPRAGVARTRRPEGSGARGPPPLPFPGRPPAAPARPRPARGPRHPGVARPACSARIARALFGTSNDRALKRLQAARAGDQRAGAADRRPVGRRRCRRQTAEFRERLANGETLDDLLPEAFATVREAAKRVLGLRHFDVQMIGGMVLHEGKIAEMKTGEGKTLVATLPVYLNALAGKGVHVVTVNDYLASRDAEWMGRIYRFLGLTVGVIVHGLTTRSAARPTPPTSPTAPTTNSASTTCATT